MAVLCGASGLREVIAFPKSYHGRDLLTGAPVQLGSTELKDYGISLLEKKSK